MMNDSVEFCLEILYKIEFAKNVCTINTLSKKFKKPAPIIRTAIYLLDSAQDDFSIYLGDTKWGDLKEDSRLIAGELDDYLLSIKHTGQYLIVKKSAYEQLTKLFQTNEEKLAKENPVIFVDDLSFKYLERPTEKTNSDEIQETIKRLKTRLKNKLLTCCKIRNAETQEYRSIIGFFDTNEEDPYVFLTGSENNSNYIYEAYPLSQLNNFWELPYDISYDREISRYNQIMSQCWEPRHISKNETLEHFKLLILDGSKMHSKVMHDLHRSSRTAKETIIDTDKLIIEFEAYFSDSLFSWIMSYGGSIVVLSPSSVREAVLKEYKKIDDDLQNQQS